MSHEFAHLLKITLDFSLFRDGNSSENFLPRGIQESRNDKFTFLGDQGICYLFLGVHGKFRGISYPKNQKIPLKIWKKIWKKKFKKNFQHRICTLKFGMFSNNTKNQSFFPKNRNKNRKILTNCGNFSDIFIFDVLKKGIRYFWGPRQILARNRGAEEL